MGDNDLLDLDVHADDYATTAAKDNPAAPVTEERTFVSEEQFQRTKAEYQAKHDTGNVRKFYVCFQQHLPAFCLGYRVLMVM